MTKTDSEYRKKIRALRRYYDYLRQEDFARNMGYIIYPPKESEHIDRLLNEYAFCRRIYPRIAKLMDDREERQKYFDNYVKILIDKFYNKIEEADNYGKTEKNKRRGKSGEKRASRNGRK